MKHYLAKVWLEGGPHWTTLSGQEVQGHGWQSLEGAKRFMRDFWKQEPPDVTEFISGRVIEEGEHSQDTRDSAEIGMRRGLDAEGERLDVSPLRPADAPQGRTKATERVRPRAGLSGAE